MSEQLHQPRPVKPTRPLSIVLDSGIDITRPLSRQHLTLTRSVSATQDHFSDTESVTSITSTVILNGRSPLSFKRLKKFQHKSLIKDVARFMHKNGLEKEAVLYIVGFVLLIKSAVGLGGYSGQGDPPLYGDMEAQRHWLSLTLHKPVSEWYFFDLNVWGLDYPPLTAYHSLFMAWVFRHFGGIDIVALRQQGQVAPEDRVKVWMRSSVLASEIVLWIPAVILWAYIVLNGSGGSVKRSGRTKLVALATILLQPAIILIDNGHFQYNTVMLGFALLAFISFQASQDLIGAFFFVASLCFKQMSLYYAPVVFAYLLGKCFWLGLSDGLNHLIAVGIVTLASFALFFLPFLSSLEQLYQSLHRIFPFARGLYEDKVANFWCALNSFVKLRHLATISTLAKASLMMTLLAILPSMAILFYVSHSTSVRPSVTQKSPPTTSLFNMALFSCSLAFFLFSFQVHEKSILLPLLPLTLLIADKDASFSDWQMGMLVNNVAVFSMWPLLKKDGLGLQYVTLTFLWNYMLGYNPISLDSTWLKPPTLVIYGIVAVIHILELVTPPPSRFPDLYIVANLSLSAAVFGVAYLWSLTRLLEEAWATTSMTNILKAAPAQKSPSLQPGSIFPAATPSDRVASPALSPRPPYERKPSSMYRRTSGQSDADSINSTDSKDKLRRRHVQS